MVERGVVSPARVVSERFGLDEAAAAYDKLDRGEITGRALVIPDPGGVGA
jgi:threonine dehydrogenase-like Zn-dependent dehydrogenase